MCVRGPPVNDTSVPCCVIHFVNLHLVGTLLVQESTFMTGKGDLGMCWSVLHKYIFVFTFKYYISKPVQKVAEDSE
jgi:hypothetical protein